MANNRIGFEHQKYGGYLTKLDQSNSLSTVKENDESPMNGMVNPTLDTTIYNRKGSRTIYVKDLSKKEINLTQALISEGVAKSILARLQKKKKKKIVLRKGHEMIANGSK